MRQMNALRVLLWCVLTLTFVSCGDDVYYTMENRDENLCNKLWITDFETEQGETGTYQLRFYSGGKGQEVVITPVNGGTNTVDREISWQWTDGSKECLQWLYADGTVNYFENVWVREHYLSGKLDGKELVFVEANYQH